MRKSQRRFIDYAKLYKPTKREQAEYRRQGVEFRRKLKGKRDTEAPF